MGRAHALAWTLVAEAVAVLVGLELAVLAGRDAARAQRVAEGARTSAWQPATHMDNHRKAGAASA